MPGIYSAHDAIIGVQSALGGRGGGLRYLLRDEFTTDRAAGAVNGTAAEPGPGGNRYVVDTGNKLSIDNSRVYMATPASAAWQLEGLLYGPAPRRAGMAFVMHWIDSDVQAGTVSTDHISVGVWAEASPSDPTTGGYAIGIETNSTAGGRVRVNLNAGTTVRIFPSLKQVDIVTMVVLRSTGAMIYIGSQFGARNVGAVAYPALRPIAFVPTGSDSPLYFGAWVKATAARIYSAAAELQPDFASWYGTAQSADDLTGGSGSISGRTADIGGSWTLASGTITLDANGAKAGGAAVATLPSAAVCGLVKATIKTGASPGIIYILFRAQDANNCLLVRLTSTVVALYRKESGTLTEYASTGAYHLAANSTHTVQIIDDGKTVRCFFDNNEFPGAGGIATTLFATETRVGVQMGTTASDTWLQDIEAHPLAVTIPADMRLTAPYETTGQTAVVTENFAGAAADLDGKTTTTGSLAWRKETGSGDIDLDGSGAALVDAANLDDAFYTIPWTDTNFADLEVAHTPPGSGYGSGDNGFAGLLFWQDANNWLALRTYIDDAQVGAAEYELVVTIAGSGSVSRRVNFGTEIQHGVAHTMRMVFDGDRFLAYFNGEPVISYSLLDLNASYSALTINRVGLYAASTNTGSLLDDFVAKSE